MKTRENAQPKIISGKSKKTRETKGETKLLLIYFFLKMEIKIDIDEVSLK